MPDKTNIDIDYENMDDLPLCEHFEWHFFQVDEEVTISENSNDDQVEWLAA